MKGLVGDDEILADGIPQIAFVGRSNVGKSSLINVLTNSKVSRTSSFPGRTQEINIFLVNNAFYLVDLPGYGFARASGMGREKIGELIDSYLFNSIYNQNGVNRQSKYQLLQQHFVGWFIQTETPVFNPEQATFMDFSVAQKGNTRFMYVLPVSETEALLEYTLFSKELLPKEEYETEIGRAHV